MEQFPTRKAALKSCELLRANINREVRSPRTVAELVTHYTEHELPTKTPYAAEVYAGYIKTWILPTWAGGSLSDVNTEASRKPVPLDAGLADVLLGWRGRCPYNRHRDYICASPDMDGKQPYWPTAGMEDHVRPAAKRAGITKRIGWPTLRHTFGTLVKSQGADVATTQSLMRHANVSVTMDRYVQAIGADKPEAQSRIVRAISFPNDPRRLTDSAVTV